MYYSKIKALYYLSIVNLYLILDIIFSINVSSDFIINNLIYSVHYLIGY